VALAEADVAADRALEERRVERRPRDLPAQFGRREPGDVATGDEDAPGVGPPLPEQDRGEPALAGAARPEDRDELAALRDQTDRAAALLEADAAVAGGRPLLVRFAPRLGGVLEEAGDARDLDARGLRGLVRVDEMADRREDVVEEGVEAEQRPARRRLGQHEP